MQMLFPIESFPGYSQWAFFGSVFTPEECEKIKSLFIDPVPAAVGNLENQALEVSIRKSNISWIKCSQETQWIYERIGERVIQCNKSRYGFNLIGFGEILQLGRYQEGDFYNWHQDMGDKEMAMRKLSIVVQLSNKEDYEGGDLEFQGYKEKASRDQGDLIIFPSFNTHRVTEVTKGERFSLVAWVSGPAFK